MLYRNRGLPIRLLPTGTSSHTWHYTVRLNADLPVFLQDQHILVFVIILFWVCPGRLLYSSSSSLFILVRYCCVLSFIGPYIPLKTLLSTIVNRFSSHVIQACSYTVQDIFLYLSFIHNLTNYFFVTNCRDLKYEESHQIIIKGETQKPQKLYWYWKVKCIRS